MDEYRIYMSGPERIGYRKRKYGYAKKYPEINKLYTNSLMWNILWYIMSDFNPWIRVTLNSWYSYWYCNTDERTWNIIRFIIDNYSSEKTKYVDRRRWADYAKNDKKEELFRDIEIFTLADSLIP